MSPSCSRKRIFDTLTSGNSARSRASTAPIPRYARPGAALMPLPAQLRHGRPGTAERDRRCALTRLAPATRQRDPAVGAEPGIFGVLLSAAGAVDARHVVAQPLIRRQWARAGNRVRARGSRRQLWFVRPRYLRSVRPVHAPRIPPATPPRAPPATAGRGPRRIGPGSRQRSPVALRGMVATPPPH